MLALVALVSATTAQLARAMRLPEELTTKSGAAPALTPDAGADTQAPDAQTQTPASDVASATSGTQAPASSLPELTASGCAGQQLEQPFLRWLDPAKYTLTPNGSLESASGWTLTGGAKLVTGNESYRVHSSSDTRSLSLPSGSSATTKPMCIATLYPTLRFFGLNSGSLLSTLKVEAIFPSALGKLTVPIGVLPGVSKWLPMLPLAYLGNFTALPLLTNGTTTVQFRFTPLGAASGWRIDDVYVDPYKGR